MQKLLDKLSNDLNLVQNQDKKLSLQNFINQH
jgi:hypothetical protein